MKMRKLFAGLAAAATLLGGLALGASTANAVDNAAETLPVTGTTLTIKADSADQLAGRTFKLYKIADYIEYAGSGSIGIQTVGWSEDSSQWTEAYKAIQLAVAEATKDNTKADDQYVTEWNTDDAGNKTTPKTYRPDDPLAWAAQPELVTGSDPASNGRIDQSPTNPWTGLTRTLAESLDVSKLGEPTSTYTVPSSNEDTSFMFERLNPGLYFIMDSTVSTDTNGSDLNNKWTNSLRMVAGTALKIKTGTDSNGNDIAATLSTGEINLKNQTLPIHKQVVKDDGETPNLTPDYNIGDTVTYQLTSELPTYTGYEKYDGKDAKTKRIYQITDTMSKGLTFNENIAGNIVVKVGDTVLTRGPLNEPTLQYDFTATVERANSGYTSQDTDPAANRQTSDAQNGAYTKITIDLSNYVNEIGKNTLAEGGTTVTVVLKATLNKDALISDTTGMNGNPNKVDLTYSNNPENVQDKTTVPGGEVNVYSFRFQLLKYAKDAGKDVPLAGAQFKVKQDDKWLTKTITYSEAGTEVKTVSWGTTDDESKATMFKSNDQGVIADFDGLKGTDADGKTITYTVKEIAAPTGYQNAILPTFTFTITPKYYQDNTTNPNADKTGESKNWGDQTISYVSFDETGTTDVWSLVDRDNMIGFQYNVQNVKNVSQLPLTGAAGIVLFTVAGLLLASAAGLVYTKSRATSRALRRH